MRNYFKYAVVAGTIGGAATTYAGMTLEDATTYSNTFFDPGSKVYDITPVWFGNDKYLFNIWLNRVLGTEIWLPPNRPGATSSGSDGPPLAWGSSPRGFGKFLVADGSEIHF